MAGRGKLGIVMERRSGCAANGLLILLLLLVVGALAAWAILRSSEGTESNVGTFPEKLPADPPSPLSTPPR